MTMGWISGLKFFVSPIGGISGQNSHQEGFSFWETVFTPVPANTHPRPGGEQQRRITGTASAPLWHPPHSHPTCANFLLLEFAYSAQGDTIGCIRPLCCRFLLRLPHTFCFWHRKAHQNQCGVPCAGLLPEVGISSQSLCGFPHNATLHAPAYFRSCLCIQSDRPAWYSKCPDARTLGQVPCGAAWRKHFLHRYLAFLHPLWKWTFNLLSLNPYIYIIQYFLIKIKIDRLSGIFGTFPEENRKSGSPPHDAPCWVT